MWHFVMSLYPPADVNHKVWRGKITLSDAPSWPETSDHRHAADDPPVADGRLRVSSQVAIQVPFHGLGPDCHRDDGCVQTDFTHSGMEPFIVLNSKKINLGCTHCIGLIQ